MGNKKPAEDHSGFIWWIWYKIQNWWYERQEQKKFEALYQRLDRNADGKFDYKANVKMMNQMRKAKK